MTDRDRQFWPESLEEQLDQLAQAASHSTGPTTPDARLVEDLRTVCTDYTRAGERVWARLAEHLAERDQTSNNVRLIASERLQTERFEHMQVEQGQFATQLAPQPKSPRRSRRVFTLVAAVLVAAVLVGSALWVLRSIHLPVGGTIVASATPQAAGTLTPPSAGPTLALNFPCPQKVSSPVFYARCQDHEIQVIQQSFKLNGNQTLTLVAGYADINIVTVRFHLDKNPYVTLTGTADSPQLANEEGNFIGGGFCNFGLSSGKLDCLESFNLDNVPAGLQALDLNVQESVDNASQGQAPVFAGAFSFSLPFHADRSAHPNLTVTANGISITLKQVLVSPIKTTIDLLNPRLNDALNAEQYSPNPPSDFTLNAGDQKLSGWDILGETLGTNGKYGPVLGTQLVIDGTHPLFNQYGEWTLTISPKIFSGATTPWVFHFTV